MKVLLSIKPSFAEKLLSGEKLYEFRKAIFKNDDVESIVIYASSPVQKVIGEFSIQKIFEMPPLELWEKTKLHSGINKEYFDKYFEGKSKGFAIKVGKMKRYDEPVDLTSIGINTPPQSFCYIRTNSAILTSNPQ